MAVEGLNLCQISDCFKLQEHYNICAFHKTLKWLLSLPILMQKSFWWRQCSDRYIISFPLFHTPFNPPFSLSLISLMVSVDIKHHLYTWLKAHLAFPSTKRQVCTLFQLPPPSPAVHISLFPHFHTPFPPSPHP